MIKKNISEILGRDPRTISTGINEVYDGSNVPEGYSRMPTAGAKKIINKTENIDKIFLDILKDKIAGSPMNEEIIWINFKLKEILEEFKVMGYNVSEYVVKQLLKRHGYKKRKMEKSKKLKETNNRNEQFENIELLKKEYYENGDQVISMDVKKKEMLGNFYRDGKSYWKEALNVNDHDFASLSDGPVIPHEIYDMKRNEGYINRYKQRDKCIYIIYLWNAYGKIHYPNS